MGCLCAVCSCLEPEQADQRERRDLRSASVCCLICPASARVGVSLTRFKAGKGAVSRSGIPCSICPLCPSTRGMLPHGSYHKSMCCCTWLSSQQLMLAAPISCRNGTCSCSACAIAWCNHYTPALVLRPKLSSDAAGGLAAAALVNVAFGCGSALWWFVFFWGLNGLLQVSACTGTLSCVKAAVLTRSRAQPHRQSLVRHQHHLGAKGSLGGS